VRVDRDGVPRGVSTNDVPKTSHDLTACMRVALREMEIPEAILQAPPSEDAAATMNRAYMGSPAVVVVVDQMRIMPGEVQSSRLCMAVAYPDARGLGDLRALVTKLGN
jgi:hypothetical protein